MSAGANVERQLATGDSLGETLTCLPLISCFRGKYMFLSNFYFCPVAYDGYSYPSAEHAFQAAKVGGSEAERLFFQDMIRQAQRPSKAKELGRQVILRADWEVIKVGVMTGIVLAKFSNHRELRRELVATGNAKLIEGNTWGDRVWGAECVNGTWVGENQLGKILMGVRKCLS